MNIFYVTITISLPIMLPSATVFVCSYFLFYYVYIIRISLNSFATIFLNSRNLSNQWFHFESASLYVNCYKYERMTIVFCNSKLPKGSKSFFPNLNAYSWLHNIEISVMSKILCIKFIHELYFDLFLLSVWIDINISVPLFSDITYTI